MKIALAEWNNTLIGVRERLKERGHVLLDNGKDADVIVIWNEVRGFGDKVVIEAKKREIRTVLMQHGRRGSSRVYPPFNEEILSDAICVWGEGDKERLMKYGTPEEKIHVTGTPIFDHLIPRVEHEGVNVVFSPEHWDQEIVENNIVAGALRRIPKVKITTKILAGPLHNPSYYDNVVISDRQAPGHFKIVADVLSTADLVVGISESTFELLAEYLDIPVVIAEVWKPKACAGDDRYLNYLRQYSPACKREKDIKKLGKVIKHQLKHPDELKEERAKAVVAEGGVGIEDPIGNIIRVIENGI